LKGERKKLKGKRLRGRFRAEDCKGGGRGGRRKGKVERRKAEGDGPSAFSLFPFTF
jgi:hypothetical protein